MTIKLWWAILAAAIAVLLIPVSLGAEPANSVDPLPPRPPLIFPDQAFLETARMTRSEPVGCVAPEPADVFFTTDSAAWLWFQMSNAQPGDVPETDWIAPGGAVFRSDAWAPPESVGDVCYSARLGIGGHRAALAPGTWRVEIYWNALFLKEIEFRIVDPAAPLLTLK